MRVLSRAKSQEIGEHHTALCGVRAIGITYPWNGFGHSAEAHATHMLISIPHTAVVALR
jgi:hypothetical protein